MNISGFLNHYTSNIICQYPALFPNAGEEVDHTGNSIAVGGESVAKHKAVEIPAQHDAEKPAEANTQHHAVQKRQCHSQLRMADALDECAAAPHKRKGGEYPKHSPDKLTGHLVNCRVIREDAEQCFAEQQIGSNADSGQGKGEHPRPVDGLDGTLLLPRRNILADHGQGGILDALRDLVDDIVDADTHTKSGGSHHADIVDEGVDIQHGEVNKARLDGHGGTQGENHLGIAHLGLEVGPCKVKAELSFSTIEEENGEDERHRLSDDGGPRRARNFPLEDAREQDVQHQVDGRGDADKQERTARVPHAAQDSRDHVIARRKEQTRAADDEILLGVDIGLRGDVHDLQDPALQADDDHRQHHSQRRNEGKKRTDDTAHFLTLAGAQRL